MIAVEGGNQADGHAPSGPNGDGPRPRGRPPRLSREGIVAAVVESLREDPDGPVTIARFAEAAGAAPMAIYRHFSDRDDLLLAVGNEILNQIELPPVDGLPWQEFVGAWMTAIHDQFLQFPQCSRLLTGQLNGAPGWAKVFGPLIAALGPDGAGLRDQALADALYWVGSSTVFHVHGAINAYEREYLKPAGKRFMDEISQHEEELRNGWTLIEYTANTMERAFEIVMGRTIAGVTDMIARQPALDGLEG